jgi:chromosome segregation ATPase
MSWKIIGAGILAAVLLLGITIFATHKISYAEGEASKVADCNTKLGNQKTTYEQAQGVAVQKAAKAQADADAQELAALRQQLQESQQQALIAQQKADSAKAAADNLNATLARLKHENKDVGKWNDACLPAALLASLHPGSDGKAPAGACR